MTFPATLSLISNVFTGRTERARAIGLWGASAGVAIALGPIAGGWLLSAAAHQSGGAALIVSNRIAAAGHPALGQAVRDGAVNAFLHGLSVGCLVAGGVAAAVMAAVFLPAQPGGAGVEAVPSDEAASLIG